MPTCQLANPQLKLINPTVLKSQLMLSCKKHLFSIPKEIHYLNCAYMSPLTKKVAAIGQDMVALKTMPYKIQASDFFKSVDAVKRAFSRLVNIDEPNRVAIIPSVSYGIANVANNLVIGKGQQIILVEEQFPSNYYTWKRLADNKGASIKLIKAKGGSNRMQVLNKQLLDAIDDSTALVTIGSVHWADGTLFDLLPIRNKCTEHGALLVIDGTQSVGAMPFDVSTIQPDALICAGYKWLMGPYSSGVAYYGSHFDHGLPIEENWINRLHSEDFQHLVNYQIAYQPLAGRYSVGEQSNFIIQPMLSSAIEQLLEWKVEAIQKYCIKISQNAIQEIRSMGAEIEADPIRCGHLFGIRLNNAFDSDRLKVAFQKEKLFVSFRGEAVRVSPNVYNDEADFSILVKCFEQARI